MASELERLLEEYGRQPHEREVERVRRAIALLAEGDLEKARYFVSVAKTDYRDVLYWADNPEAAKIDKPEKKKRVREMLGKLGVKPPEGLEE